MADLNLSATPPLDRFVSAMSRCPTCGQATGGDSSELDQYTAHFQARVVQDAILEASVSYWRRRADTFATIGTPTCLETAQACRNHARLLEVGILPALDELP